MHASNFWRVKFWEWTENERGCGQVFGVRQLEEFLEKFDLDLICRGHQVMEEGYGFFGEARQLVTIFSAKNYTGDFDNDAAVMSVDEKLQCSFNVFKGDFSKYEALQKKQTIKKKKVLEDKLSEPRKVFK